MIDTTVNQSPITAPSSAFILGQVSSNLNAFEKLESSDIVRSLFGIGETEPNAINITEALVNSIAVEDQFKARALLQDRGVAGVIWRYTSSKKFMIELSKAFAKTGNFLTLSLVMVKDNVSTCVRELVRFNKDGTTFMDRHMRSIEFNTEAVDTLTKIHDEAIKKLEEKYLKPEEPEEPSVEQEQPMTPTPPAPEVWNKKDVCHFDVTGLESFGDKELELCTKIWDPLGKVIENGVTDCDDILQWLVENQPLEDEKYAFTYGIEHHDDDSICGLYHIHVQFHELPLIPPEDPEPAPEAPKVYTLSQFDPYTICFREWKDWDDVINGTDEGTTDIDNNTVIRVGDAYSILHDGFFAALTDPKDIETLNEKFQQHAEELAKKGLDVDGDEERPAELNLTPDSNTNPETLPPADPDDYQEEAIPPELRKELLDKGVSESDIKAIEDGKVTVREVLKLKEAEEEMREEQEPPAPPKAEETHPPETAPKYTYNIIVEGHELIEVADKVRAFVSEGIRNVATNSGGEFNIKQEIMKNFHTNVLDVQIERVGDHQTDITIVLQEIVEQEKKETTDMPTWKLEIDDTLKDVRESITTAMNDLITNNGSNPPDCDAMTKELRAITEIDLLDVGYDANNNTYYVRELVPTVEPAQPTEEVPSADIHDVEVQHGLMRGIFGVVDPAITHVQTFLRKHLREENNPGFLATETFPTEVMQVWNERPYNFTLSIVKFKDGRFYRIFLAVTNPGLPDQTWLATNDIPGRWIQIGRDIQMGDYRPSFQRPHRRY